MSKPVVAMALSRGTHDMMFRAEDLARLNDAAHLLGPVAEANPSSIAPLLRDATIAITGWGSPRFDAPLLESAPKLRLIAHSAGSLKGVVSDDLYDRGIRITTSASANAAPVAETAVAMMVVMLKRIPWLLAAKGQRAALQQVGPIRELRDVSVGLLGASRVGREVIRLLRSYPRLRIKVYDPYLKEEDARKLGVEKVSLEDACASDVVSVHAPSIPETRHMLNARTLALIPDHAVLLNTARGSIIDEAALLAEVRRRPLYVYLDVTDPEPPPADSPLTREPNIILTPHIAGAMGQSRRDMGALAIEQVLRFLAGQTLDHEVTRQMLATQA